MLITASLTNTLVTLAERVPHVGGPYMGKALCQGALNLFRLLILCLPHRKWGYEYLYFNVCLSSTFKISPFNP